MCKRGMVDMRKRFRGNHPIGIASEEGESESGGQLYAGKPAFSNVVKATDWKEDASESR